MRFKAEDIMKLKWRNISLQYKLLIICSLIIALMSFAIFGYMMPRVKESIVNTKKSSLQDVVDMTIHNVNMIYLEYKDNNITLEEAQKKALDFVRNVRYGPEGKDYLWINDFQPVMLMHPFSKSLEGQNVDGLKDSNGKLFFREMVELCKSKGSGYVSYMWQWKDNANLIVPKISYVKEYKPFNWMIGTGLYFRDVEAQVQQEFRALYVKLFIVIGVIVFATFFIIFIFGKTIKKQIGLSIDFSRKLAVGDLTGRIPLNQKDEFGQLAGALNESVEKLEELISNIINLSQCLVQAVQEITAGNENLSQRTSEQASSLEEIASTLEETSASINQNAENSRTAKDISDKTSILAEEGGRIVSDAVVSINEINESSRKIEEIIAIINEIAFQTNLLALNAAVEAARAGEQGRGFAVVAGEVRNLAQRSANAAKEIVGLIKATLQKVDRGTDLSNKSGEALKNIIESIKNVRRYVSEVAAASEEQRQGSVQVNIAVSELDSMTQQNAGLVEETASASEEIANQAQELLSMVEKFKIADSKKSVTQTAHLKKIHLLDKHKAVNKTNPAGKKEKETAEIIPSGGTVKTPDIQEILSHEGFESF
jgi:methyl-accepting chemotaxis protein